MTDIEQLARDHFNEPVLIAFDLGRLVGYAEDEDDCYLVVDFPAGGKPKRVWVTGVGGYIFLDRLKGQGHVRSNSSKEWDDLTRLDTMLTLNGVPKVEEFVLKLNLESPD